MACAALISLSNRASSDSDSNSTDNRESSRPRTGTDAPGTMAGTTWIGNLNCDEGGDSEVEYRFAESGNPIYRYETRDGVSETELTSPGQVFRYLPPGGGVTTVEVDSLSVSSDRVSHTESISHEGGAGGTLEQSQSSMATDITLAGAELEVETKFRSQSTISQPGIVVPGNEHVVTCSGKIRQQ